MTKRVDNGAQMVNGFGGQMNELYNKNSFHDAVCFAIQICTCLQKSGSDIRRMAVNRR